MIARLVPKIIAEPRPCTPRATTSPVKSPVSGRDQRASGEHDAAHAEDRAVAEGVAQSPGDQDEADQQTK